MAPFETVLLTGATGFVGRHLSSAIRARFPDAKLFVLCRPGEKPPHAKAQQLTAELTDEASVTAAVGRSRPDVVFHLAAQASVDQAIGGAEQTWRVNFCVAMWLGAAVARVSPNATFLFVSSAEVYGASFGSGPVAEDTPLLPINPYARAKAAAEGMLADVLPPTARLIETGGIPETKDYAMRTGFDWIGKDVPRADARWMGSLLGQLSHRQLVDAFRAGHFPDDQIDAYVSIVESRIHELQSL